MKVTALMKMIGRTEKRKDDLQKPAELQELGQTVSMPAAYTALLNRLSEYTAQLWADRRAQHTTKICKLACLTLLFSWILGVECTSVSLNRLFWLVDFEWRQYFCWCTCTLYICTMNKILFYPAAPPATNIHPSPPDSNTSFFSTQITFSTPPASCLP